MRPIVLSLLIAAAILPAVTAQDRAKGPADLVAARQARDRGSIEDLQQLIAKAKKDAAHVNTSDAYAHLALLYMWLCEAIETGQDNALFKKAAEDGVAAAEKAVALNPQSSNAHWLLGDLLNQLIPHIYGGGMRYGQRANAELDRAIELDANNANAYTSRAISYYYTPDAFGGSKTKALELLKKAAELDASADTPHIWLAMFYLEAKDKDAALREITRALNLNADRSFTKYVYEQVKATQRFDELVRDDFFAGMMGDTARLDRGMKFTEDILAKNPNHADALVWHGGGLLARAAKAYANGDGAGGDRMWKQGLEEMNRAATLEPENMRVKIGRSATLVGLAQAGWDSSDVESRELLQIAVRDYEQVYASQKPFFSKISMHSRGELLFGLASGYSLLGDQEKTRKYLQLIIEHCADTSYDREAQRWLQFKTIPTVQHECRGCHVKSSN